MRLSLKLSLLLAAASAGPLLLQAFVTTPAGTRALRRQLDELHAQSASTLALDVDRGLNDKFQALSLAKTALPLSTLRPEERDHALLLIYKQTGGAGVVGLFDQQGEAVTDPISYPKPRSLGLLQQEAVDDEGLQRFARNVPLETALSAGFAVGPVYVSPGEDGRPIPRVVAAQALTGPGRSKWVLAVELSLRHVVERFAAFRAGSTGRALLVDGAAAVIAHPDPAQIQARPVIGDHPLLRGEGDPNGLLGAVATVPVMGWKAIVEQDEAEALAPIRSQIHFVALWCAVGLLAAFALGFTAVRTVTRPVGVLSAAASKVAAGSLNVEVGLRGKDELAQLGGVFNAMVRGLRERERLKESFSRYLSEELADRVLDENSEMTLGGDVVKVTVMFVDMRGFSAMSARHPPEVVVELLNEYYRLVVRVILKYGGTINKFMGDEVMAMFGAPKKLSGSEVRAVAAALEIRQLVAAFNEVRRSTGSPAAEFGIGIATGEVVAGNVGAEERMEYTVIGEAVNIAHWLQEHSAEREVLINTATLQRVMGRFQVEPKQLEGSTSAAHGAYRVLRWAEGEDMKVRTLVAEGR